MLDQNDLKKIGEEFGKVMEDNVMPVLEKIEERMGGLEGRMGGLEERMDRLEGTVANLPDKAFITDKLADLEGSMVARQRKEDQKVNLLISFLWKKKVLDDPEIKQLDEFHVFPSLQK